MPLGPGYLTSVTLTIGYENCTCEGDMYSDPRHYTPEKIVVYPGNLTFTRMCLFQSLSCNWSTMHTNVIQAAQ